MFMFYNDRGIGFMIKGIYRVKGEPKEVVETGRGHTALSIRIKGNSRIIQKSGELSLEDGTLAYFPAGIDYKRITESYEEYIAIHLEAFYDTQSTIVSLDGCEYLYPIFDTMCTEWERNGTSGYNRCMLLLYRMLDELNKRESASVHAVPSVIRSGVELMQKSFRDPNLTVSDLAAACHISDAYFRRIYGAHFGVSPIDDLLSLRFDYAQSLLRSGYYQTKEIALLSGFSDVKYFRTAFKKRFGITPLTYANGIEI